MKKLFSIFLVCVSIISFGQQDFLNLVPYRKGELWGYADRNGKIIIPCQFSSAKCFEQNGYAIVGVNDNNTLIDSKGNPLFEPIPLTIIQSNENIYTTIGRNENNDIVWGYIDEKGKKIGEDYESVSPFKEGLARVQKNKKYGFINPKGEIVIACKYSFAFDFQEGLACVQKAKRYGAIDKNGKVVIPFHYTRLFPFKDGFAQIGGKLEITDTSEPSDDPNEFNVSATISVMDTPDLKFIDKNNKLYQMGNYQKTPLALQKYLYPNGMARNFELDPQRVYYKNEKDQYIAKGKYYYGEFFKEGLAMIMTQDKLCGYIDKTGKEIVVPKYQDAKDFYNGFACVQQNEKWGFVDKTGKLVIPCKFDDYSYFENGAAWVEFEGKNGIIDQTGKFLVAPEFSYGDRFRQGTLGLIEVKQGYIDTKGRKYWED